MADETDAASQHEQRIDWTDVDVLLSFLTGILKEEKGEKNRKLQQLL